MNARPVGLIASLFRPSDDACVFPFLIPSNMMAVVSLRQLAEMYRVIIGDAATRYREDPVRMLRAARLAAESPRASA